MKNSFGCAVVAVFLGLPGVLTAQTPKPWHEGNAAVVDAWTRAQQKRAAGNTNLWVARGIVADRLTRQVSVAAEAMGIEAGAIAEFLLVGENSEKDYEALAVSFARASDVCHALEFIGLPRGTPVNAAACRFWPKGERVTIAQRPFDEAQAPSAPLQLCLVSKGGQHAVADSFTYVGSVWTGEEGRVTCLADRSAPGGIVSTYNERTVVLDVPGQSAQGEVYGDLVVAEHPPKAGQRLLLTLSPEARPDGTRRVAEIVCEARAHTGTATNAGLAAVSCVTQGDGLAPCTNDVRGTLERLAAIARAGRDPFVRLSFADDLTVATVRDLARVLKAVDGEGGIRVDAPPEGQLYYKAFLPDDKWRTRGERFAQPWELRIGRGQDGQWHDTLVQVLEDWSKQGQLTPDLTVKEHPLKDASELPAMLRTLGGGINTLFIFVPTDAPLSCFMPAVRRVHAELPTVFVFGG